MCFKHVYYSAHLITCYESNGIFTTQVRFPTKYQKIYGHIWMLVVRLSDSHELLIWLIGKQMECDLLFFFPEIILFHLHKI